MKKEIRSCANFGAVEGKLSHTGDHIAIRGILCMYYCALTRGIDEGGDEDDAEEDEEDGGELPGAPPAHGVLLHAPLLPAVLAGGVGRGSPHQALVRVVVTDQVMAATAAGGEAGGGRGLVQADAAVRGSVISATSRKKPIKTKKTITCASF